MEELIISIVGSAFLAGCIEVIALMFNHNPGFFPLWLVVFLCWWGVVLLDGDWSF